MIFRVRNFRFFFDIFSDFSSCRVAIHASRSVLAWYLTIREVPCEFWRVSKIRFFRVIFLHSEHVNRRCSFSAVSTSFDLGPEPWKPYGALSIVPKREVNSLRFIRGLWYTLVYVLKSTYGTYTFGWGGIRLSSGLFWRAAAVFLSCFDIRLFSWCCACRSSISM